MKKLNIILISLGIVGTAVLQNSLSAAANTPSEKNIAKATLGVLNQISIVDKAIKNLKLDAEGTVDALANGQGKKVVLTNATMKKNIKAAAQELNPPINDSAVDALYTSAK